MIYHTLKIVDQTVADKIDLDAIDQRFSELPPTPILEKFNRINIFFIAKKSNDSEFDVWTKKDEIFIKIPLLYEEVLHRTEDEVSELCLLKFKEYVEDLNEDFLDQKNALIEYPTIFQLLDTRQLNPENSDLDSIFQAIEAYKHIIENDEYFFEQIQLLLKRLEEDRSMADALQVSKKTLELMVNPDML